MTGPIVRAAGGLVVRRGESGPEVLLVHRPRYDDWTFPKGKRDPGETDEQCAVREVEEETGVRCRLRTELLPTRYADRRRRTKVVRYWLMEQVSAASFVPNDEIDDVVWVPVSEAAERLSYPHDVAVLANVPSSFTSRSPATP